MLKAKCKPAFHLLSHGGINGRLSGLEKAHELGFALLLHFASIEAALKLLRYWEHMDDDWPDKLRIHGNWRALRELKALDRQKYDVLIGQAGASLRSIRDRVAHEGANTTVSEYRQMAAIACWGLGHLRVRLPSQVDMSKKAAMRRQARAMKQLKSLSVKGR